MFCVSRVRPVPSVFTIHNASYPMIGPLGPAIELLGLQHVSRDDQRAAAVLLDDARDFVERVFAPRSEDHVRARFRQRDRDSTTNSSAGASDERDAAIDPKTIQNHVRRTLRQTRHNRNTLIALTARRASRTFGRMTYCVAVRVDQGLVFASDSRTNAGVDHISTYTKMHHFFGDGERFFTMVTAGNLATSRAVVTRLRRDIEEGAGESLATVKRLTGAAGGSYAALRSGNFLERSLSCRYSIAR